MKIKDNTVKTPEAKNLQAVSVEKKRNVVWKNPSFSQKRAKRFFFTFNCKKRKNFVSAVILAAGSGTRMDSDKTKQWISVNGIPIVIRSILAFENNHLISEIIVCAKSDEIEIYGRYLNEFKISKLKCVVAGGENRQKSALIGFKNISDDASYVLFHDAARCLVTDVIIRDTVNAGKKYRVACAAAKCRDTVKLSDGYSTVKSTLDRENVWLAQTPQVFKTEIYRAAAYTAIKDEITATDDSFLAENLGFKVRIVDTGYENIKITSPLDLVIAKAILDEREKGNSNV